MSYIRCENTALGYEGKTVTEGLNFEVNAGDYLCIIGENGVGKSTLVKALLNLRKPLKGSITRGDGLKSFEIGYLPQQTLVQKDFPATVWEVVLSGCLNRLGLRPFYSQKEKAVALENMKKMDILSLKNKCFRDLSGGQQQRVLLARALCATGKLLLLDEPVAGLDPRATTEMYEIIAGLNRENITIIMVSHDLHSAVSYASHILHVGRTQQFFGRTQAYVQTELYRRLIGKEGVQE
jgi:zinc transport system ATP-binding protein